MAETSKNKIYYNDNEDSVADVLADMKKLAESADAAIENVKYDDKEIQQTLENKVDKEDGKELSSNDFTDEYKNKLESLENYNDSEVKNDITTLKGNITTINNKLDNIASTRGHIYTIRRKISNNTSATWERLDDAVGLIANATKNGGVVVNDFDDLAPWSEIKSCNYDITNKKVKAWFGDANFNFDGSNGDVYTYIPETYIKVYQENDYDYILIADYPKTGFTRYDSFYISRYVTKLVDGVLHSYSGLIPEHSKTISQFRTLATSLGEEFSLLDYRFFVIQMLYLVEYADYNSQSKLGTGLVNGQSAKALIAETNVNRIIVSSTNLYVGRIVAIGTDWWNTSIAINRTITKVENYTDGSVTGKVIYFDGDPVNIAVNNTIWGIGQTSGQCDELGMKSGCLINDGIHSMIYRGIENIFGNMWQFVDGMNIKDRVMYLCKDHTKYKSDFFESPYKAIGYTNGDTNGYAKTLGFDPDEPLARFPTEVGAGASSGTSDYYYQDAGNRIAHVGGYFGNGLRAGLWCWLLDDTSALADLDVGCRVLIDNQE